MIAFAGNSLLCRLALKQTGIDAASFTFVRIFSGAVALWVIMEFRRRLLVEKAASPLVGLSSDSSLLTRQPPPSQAKSGRSSLPQAGNWPSAFALFAYAAGFSFAYVSLSAGTGALLLFGAVQATMIFWGLRCGERLHVRQLFGLALALTGLVVLLFPDLLVGTPSTLNYLSRRSPAQTDQSSTFSSAPPLSGSILMLSAGVAWGIYSLRGKTAGDPIAATTGNFLRAVPLAAVLSIALFPWAHIDRSGIGYAALSGAIASGLGYVIWYTALSDSMPVRLGPVSAATVQLSVPVLAATGGILLLAEPITFRYLLASIAILGGIALAVIEKRRVA